MYSAVSFLTSSESGEWEERKLIISSNSASFMDICNWDYIVPDAAQEYVTYKGVYVFWRSQTTPCLKHIMVDSLLFIFLQLNSLT